MERERKNLKEGDVVLQNRTSHEKYGFSVGLCLLILDKMGWSEQSHSVFNTGVQETNHTNCVSLEEAET